VSSVKGTITINTKNQKRNAKRTINAILEDYKRITKDSKGNPAKKN
jgi:hypothetical protein